MFDIKKKKHFSHCEWFHERHDYLFKSHLCSLSLIRHTIISIENLTRKKYKKNVKVKKYKKHGNIWRLLCKAGMDIFLLLYFFVLLYFFFGFSYNFLKATICPCFKENHMWKHFVLRKVVSNENKGRGLCDLIKIV